MQRSKESLDDWQLKEIEDGMKDAREGRVRTRDQLLTDLDISQANQPSGAPEGKNKRYRVFTYSYDLGWDDIGSVDSLDQVFDYARNLKPEVEDRKEIMVTDSQDTAPYNHYISKLKKDLIDVYSILKYESEED